MPLSAALFTSGIAKMGHEIIYTGGLAEASIFLLLGSCQTVALGLIADMINKKI